MCTAYVQRYRVFIACSLHVSRKRLAPHTYYHCLYTSGSFLLGQSVTRCRLNESKIGKRKVNSTSTNRVRMNLDRILRSRCIVEARCTDRRRIFLGSLITISGAGKPMIFERMDKVALSGERTGLWHNGSGSF